MFPEADLQGLDDVVDGAAARELDRPAALRAAVGRGAARAGKEPPVWAVKRPARPYKIAIQNRVTAGNANDAGRPRARPDRGCPMHASQNTWPCSQAVRAAWTQGNIRLSPQ
jgi:hypothetical protein